MMKSSSKRVIVGLSIVACLAWAIPAHAGGGMGTGGFKSVSAPMSCRLIMNAPNQPQQIHITDGFADDTVKVGAAVLYCQPAVATTVPGTGPSTTPISAPDTITCYNLSNVDQAKENVNFTDPFGTQSVTTLGISVFCVPAVTNSIGQ